ncbi:VIT and vWA domain-containing protein [Thiorhodovibrio frisius]|uniref:Mg-chelatase subunit ChlD n=1 Tax=Thiorhodovibrio frisius TaxID=631362 RepID=H8YWK3_9GAMM|nr:VIT and VWA domain-containing protein [Thiorhodovibrio frisius]EIC22829.1 uncharacterized protein Thi970DRAFT_00464 [Thiorhodovibrio frisius]WPL22914.1 marine proteobacterial sortase target protein [Thiorhodovibrio frisius]
MDQTVAPQTPVLTATAIRGQFLGLLGELRIAQTFVNQESVDIEAVFTFPVPLEAVLLGVSVRINGRELEGQILASQEAEEEYEDAIASGDKAILLQSAGPGRYTVNVGHLLPGERAELEYRYALLGVWNQDSLRLLLPTTLAPRYGDPQRAGLAPHQIPGVSLAAEHRFSLALDLGGALASARVESPSHAIQTQREGERQRVTLAADHCEGTAPMDRDLVLLIHAEAAARGPAAVVAPDGEGALAWLSLQPDLKEHAEPAARDLVLVIDCSGSMAGVSMEQTRQALQTIVERLLPSDRVNLIAFGSSPDALFPTLQPANQVTFQALKERLMRLDADLGGTELGAALQVAFSQAAGGVTVESRPLDILLITDGDVWGAEQLIASARQSGHRLFTVGVGASVAEDLVRGLAEATEGACLLVHPNERMSDQILRHFERLRAPRASLTLEWPQAPHWSWPDRAAGLFAGDTLHRLAGFAALPEGELTLTTTGEDDRQQTQCLRLEAAPDFLPADVLPRLAAARRLDSLPEAEAKALALKHQLVSAYTHFVLRDVASEKASGLPELRQVPQMLAAGWGGLGDVCQAAAPIMECRQEMLSAREPLPPSLAEAEHLSNVRFNLGRRSSMDGDQQPREQRKKTRTRALANQARARSRDTSPPPASDPDTADLFPDTEYSGSTLPLADIAAVHDWLLAQAARLADDSQPLPSLTELSDAGVPEHLIADLRQLQRAGASEEALVATLLHLFLNRQSGLGLSREAQRRLRFICQRELPDALRARIDEWVAAWCAQEVA